MNRRASIVRFAVMLATAAWASSAPPLAKAAERGAVTMALHVAAPEDREPRELLDALAPLMFLAVESRRDVRLVERQRLELVLRELGLRDALAGGDDSRRKRLAQLVSADLLATVAAERRPGEGNAAWRATLRIVEASTARIVSRVEAPLRGDSLEEAARQFAEEASAAATRDRRPTLAIAVAPFESIGRFARLRPLERGARDMLVASLAAAAGRAPAVGEGAPSRRVQILQRSDLESLLREIDLARSGLAADAGAAGETPSRGAAYWVRGSLDERVADSGRELLVEVELWRAERRERIETWRESCPPSEFGGALTKLAERIVARATESGGPASASPRASERFEVERLLERALDDLRRLTRRCPIDAGVRVFPLGEVRLGATPTPVDSIVGRALLGASIDRLESVLLIEPDSPRALFALGVARGFHVPGVRDLAVADERLRKVYRRDPSGELAAAALAWLAELDFHHGTGARADDKSAAADERIWYAFRHMPEAGRDARWARLPTLVAAVRTDAVDVDALDFACGLAATQDTPHRETLALALAGLLRRESESPRASAEQRAAWRLRLAAWTRSGDPPLVRASVYRLAEVELAAGRRREAAVLYEEGVRAFAGAEQPAAVQTRENFRIHAARTRRLAGDVREALATLLAGAPPPLDGSLNRGLYGLELGACHEALGDREAARAAYVAAAEACPSVVDNSPLLTHLARVGGPPLDERRGVDVEYVEPARTSEMPRAARWFVGRQLASDGRRLYVTVGAAAGSRRRRVAAYEPESGAWSVDSREFDGVTALAASDAGVWVGTEGDGAWRGRVGADDWRRWSLVDGLPDPRVTAILPDASGAAFVGIGDRAGGGIVRIDGDGRVREEAAGDAPRRAPRVLWRAGSRVLADCGAALYQRLDEDGRWAPAPPPGGVPIAWQDGRFFVDGDAVWASALGRELLPWSSRPAALDAYRAAWFPAGLGKAGGRIEFVATRGDAIWFGGDGRDGYNSVGLYRFFPERGTCDVFGPRDGFRPGTKRVDAGAWRGDSLWLAANGELIRVTPRTPLVDGGEDD